MAVMDAKELKVTGAAQGRQDLRDLQASRDSGCKGEPGVRGPPGQKGERGESGKNGIPGNPGVMSFKNWKECAWKNLNEEKDHGQIKVNSYDIETKNSLTYNCCSINFSF